MRAIVFVALACLVPWGPPWAALLAGLVFGLTGEHPFATAHKRWGTLLLQLSVVGLGAAMNLNALVKAGVSGALSSALLLAVTMLATWVLAKAFRVEPTTSVLLGAGTAICGGSAIAAVSSAIGAKSESTSIALAVVFILNAVALMVFPPMGQLAGLSQVEFGLWSALAIHDTSSVVGASMRYGAEALSVATTVKLARALWIVPLTWAIARMMPATAVAAGAVKKPWFILGFLLAAALVTWVPVLAPLGAGVAQVARHALILSLFVIGSGVGRQALRAVGPGPFLLGISLWLLVAAGTLALIRSGLLRV